MILCLVRRDAKGEVKGQAALEIHYSNPAEGARNDAVCRQAGFRRSQKRIHRRADLPENHAGQRRRRLGHRQMGLPACGKDFDSVHPSSQRQAILIQIKNTSPVGKG